MATAARKLTYDDYVNFPSDGHRHEIIAGEEYMTPSPDVPHQRASRKLETILDEYVVRNKLGEVFDAPIDVVLSAEDVVVPDVIFISTARASIIERKNIQGAPDLVVEILSPSTAAYDRGAKRALYERSGVREYWIVDSTSELLEVHEFGSPRRLRIYKAGQAFESALFPGLKIRLSDLF